MELLPKPIIKAVEEMKTSAGVKASILILLFGIVACAAGWMREANSGKGNTEQEIKTYKRQLERKDGEINYWQQNYFELKKSNDVEVASLREEIKELYKDRIRVVKSDNKKIKKFLKP